MSPRLSCLRFLRIFLSLQLNVAPTPPVHLGLLFLRNGRCSVACLNVLGQQCSTSWLADYGPLVTFVSPKCNYGCPPLYTMANGLAGASTVTTDTGKRTDIHIQDNWPCWGPNLYTYQTVHCSLSKVCRQAKSYKPFRAGMIHAPHHQRSSLQRA